jgi:hypothetical protein
MTARGERAAVRAAILEVLDETRLSDKEQLATLKQCASHYEVRDMLETAAAECGMTMTSVMCGDHLELYCELESSRREDCSVSKGWDEPGFRCGKTVLISPSDFQTIADNADEILRFCATRGVAATFEERDGFLDVSLESVIYLEGFNARVLAQVVRYLDTCHEKVEAVVAG